jgi:hypothetical protein
MNKGRQRPFAAMMQTHFGSGVCGEAGAPFLAFTASRA